MTYKKIETSREIRHWITDIFIPAGVILGVIISLPETKQKFRDVKNRIKSKIHWKIVEETLS